MQNRDEALLDEKAVRSLFGPSGDWSERCGRAVRQRRQDLGFTLQRLADLTGTTLQTISRIESGQLVPRDRMKAAIAYALALEVQDLWTYPTLREISDRAAAS